LIRVIAWAGALLLCHTAKNAWQVHHGTCTMAPAKICNSTSRTTIDRAAPDQRAQTAMESGAGRQLCTHTHRLTPEFLAWKASRQGGRRGNAPAVMLTEATLQQTAQQHSASYSWQTRVRPAPNAHSDITRAYTGVRPAAGCTGGSAPLMRAAGAEVARPARPVVTGDTGRTSAGALLPRARRGRPSTP
jgi:hypothetical protein